MSPIKRETGQNWDERDLSQDEMDLVVGKLTQISREATLDYAIRVGSLIVHYFYGGDTTRWHDKKTKPPSFRRLAERPDLPMSPTALYRCVATFVLCERLNVVTRWRYITVTHLRTVLNLETADQTRLLSAANSERWTARRLETEARAARVGRPRVGRRPSAPLLKLARGLTRCLGENGELLACLSASEELSEDDHRQVQETLEGVRVCLDRACAALRAAPPPKRPSGPLRKRSGPKNISLPRINTRLGELRPPLHAD